MKVQSYQSEHEKTNNSAYILHRVQICGDMRRWITAANIFGQRRKQTAAVVLSNNKIKGEEGREALYGLNPQDRPLSENVACWKANKHGSAQDREVKERSKQLKISGRNKLVREATNLVGTSLCLQIFPSYKSKNWPIYCSNLYNRKQRLRNCEDSNQLWGHRTQALCKPVTWPLKLQRRVDLAHCVTLDWSS